ncbi:MMPL family transporter [Natrinema sp. 1APR25-10V2]|uniref:efflux RND transporter permease subunit n=1 Tax=Natrinema sp. 1APR25-10V2 TaxID=2951081 RepID=UPI002874CC8A|nr:MMPL family transporter [Natrinema sp. 1APR25-10V2]MDS0477431.1 MMPL family transporter [Natrinema sp. 1APR25-10V2]
MNPAERYAAFVTAHSKTVIAVVLVLTLVVGSGAGSVDSGLSIAGFDSDSTEAEKYDAIQENFTTEGENTTVVQVVVRGDNVLSKESLLETLRFQRAVADDSEVNATLRERQSMVGLSNVVATTAIRQSQGRNETGGGQASAGPGSATPTLSAQISQLESMSESEVEATVERVLAPDSTVAGPVDPYSLLPTDYESGSTTASGRVLFVFQETSDATGDDLPPAVVDAQLEMQELSADGISSDSFVFGAGIVDEESTQATGESFAIISPIALLLILGALGIAYRDVFDVVLGLLGVGLVLAWMAGFMGWAGIGVTQILIAVPFLLIGLSIDYALHVVMRYREAQLDDPDASLREAMTRGLAGVVVAIGAATFTTAVGFLSNAVSPLASIREFGIVSAVGIGAAFLVFGLLLPALKLEVDGLLERFGFARRTRAFGRGGAAGRLLGVGADIAERAPYVVIAIALVLSAAGGAAATDIDTSLDQTDFLPRDSPAWMDSLPESFQPSDYELRANAEYINANFAQARDRSRAEFLIEGPVTDPDTLERVAAGREDSRNTSSAVVLADGTLQVAGPLETIESVAATNETVAAMVAEADTDGDGVPDENLTAIYDAVYAADPAAAEATIHREDGEYRSLRLSVGLSGSADTGTVTEEMRAVATTIEGGTELTVTATGQPIIEELVQRGLLSTLVNGFLITFGVIIAFLTAIFWLRYRTVTLGGVVLAPVVLAQAWLFGTMYLAGIPFTSETAIIAAIGIGIGVDYAIHIGERFIEEYRGDSIAALRRTVRGTGGALLASAATTAAGFGVLVFALVPSLQRFGFVTGVAIGYAFLASVLVLPSLLAVWVRLTGYDGTEAAPA